MASQKLDKDRMILERIMSLKQFLNESDEPQDYHELGICYFHIKNYEQSIKYFEELIQSFPDYIDIASVYALQIYAKIQLHDYSDSLLLLDKRLEFYPDDSRLLGMKAHCLLKLGQSEQAMEIHKKILEIEPENVNSLNSLGYLLTQLQDPRLHGEAFGYLKKALEKKPEYPAYLDSLGVLLLHQGNLESARVALERALLGMPENSEILDHLGELLASKNKAMKPVK